MRRKLDARPRRTLCSACLFVVGALGHDPADLLVAELHLGVIPIHVFPSPLEQFLVVGRFQVLAAIAV